ncbi:MAG TPA: hypothetical protein VFG73_08600 [Rhodanobacteraceae bacterium]|nr:hypothetical protein [Rhodanobacteraceae bacterium]
MTYRLPFAVLYLSISILFVLAVNRQANVARTIQSILFPAVFGLFAWDDWHSWQAASGGQALWHSIAFALTCAAFILMLIALARRLWWLRRHSHAD